MKPSRHGTPQYEDTWCAHCSQELTVGVPLQAYLGQQSSQAAVSDLRQAVKLASHEEKGIIQAVLEKAESSAGQSVGQNPRADGQNSQNPSRRTPQEQAMPSAAQTPTNVEEPDSPSEHREADGEIEAGSFYSLP